MCLKDFFSTNPKKEVIMRKALMIGSLTAFIALAAIAANRRDVAVPPVSTEEVAGGPGIDHITKPVDEKSHGCPCSSDSKPPKKGNK